MGRAWVLSTLESRVSTLLCSRGDGKSAYLESQSRRVAAGFFGAPYLRVTSYKYSILGNRSTPPRKSPASLWSIPSTYSSKTRVSCEFPAECSGQSHRFEPGRVVASFASGRLARESGGRNLPASRTLQFYHASRPSELRAGIKGGGEGPR